MSENDSEEERFTENEALDLLADETRVGILKALGEATLQEPGLPRLSYTDLRKRAGIRDSGKFNYHLKKLEGIWVEHTDSGYKLPHRGQLIYDALVAGSFTGDAAPDEFEIADRCPYCDTPFTAYYTENDVRFIVRCPSCGAGGLNVHLPPNSLTVYEDGEALVDAVTQRSRSEIIQMARGYCPSCSGPVRGELHLTDSETFLPWGLDERPLDVFATFHCEVCTAFHYTSVGEVASADPRVIAFWTDHGRDITTGRTWNVEWMFTDRQVTIESADPVRVRVDIIPDDGMDDSLHVTIGPDGTVEAVTDTI